MDKLLEVLQSIEQDYDSVCGSLKQAFRRVHPGFDESYYAYTSCPELPPEV